MARPSLRFCRFLFPFVLLPACALTARPLHAQHSAAESKIHDRMGELRGLPEDVRGKRTGELALEIRALPAGPSKVSLALGLAGLATEGDPGRDNLQAVTTTLTEAVKETPVPERDGKPAQPYIELAKLVRYEGMKTDLTDPQLAEARKALIAEDEDISKQDFTLTDVTGKKKYTLSELKGKIVMVNFWATWCPPCMKEMPALDAIYTHYQGQGLVILAITDEDLAKVGKFMGGAKWQLPILLDPGHKVGARFHISSIPRTFVFNREGKLVAEAIDGRTQMQFFAMLARGGLKPQ